jgi:hypothetical protein
VKTLSIITCALLFVACGDDGASTTPDAATGDSTGLTFRDGGPAGADGARDRGAPGDGGTLGDGARDGFVDAARDSLTPDVLAPDVLSPDILPPDVLPADTLAHKCTAFAEFTCTPQSSFIRRTASCTDHKARKLQLTCLSTTCLCIVNGKSKKNCASSGSGCTTCQQAFNCCNFPTL